MPRSPGPAVLAIAGLLALAGCGGGGTTTATTRIGAVVPCTGHPVSSARDPRGDVVLLSPTGPTVPVRAPGLDLLAGAVTRGPGVPLCLTVRTAARLPPGATVSLETIHRTGAGYAMEHYDVVLEAGRGASVSRTHGEPRYPVRARVLDRGDRLDVALLEVPAPLGARFGWKVEASDARSARDGLPSLTADRWVAFPSGRIVGASAYRP